MINNLARPGSLSEYEVEPSQVHVIPWKDGLIESTFRPPCGAPRLASATPTPDSTSITEVHHASGISLITG